MRAWCVALKALVDRSRNAVGAALRREELAAIQATADLSIWVVVEIGAAFSLRAEGKQASVLNGRNMFFFNIHY